MSDYTPAAQPAPQPQHAPVEARPAPDTRADDIVPDSGATHAPHAIDPHLVGQMYGVDPEPPSMHDAGAAIESAIESGVGMMKALAVVMSGERDPNKVTDAVFYALHPTLPAGTRLAPGTDEARQWVHILDKVVRPALALHLDKPANGNAAPAATASAPSATASAPASAPAATGEAGGAHPGHSEAYLTQNVNSYNDDVARQQWGDAKQGDDYGAKAGTCNVTGLAMALISLCDGDAEKVRAAALAKLRQSPLRPGAVVTVGGKRLSLAAAMADDACAEKINLPDLLVAIGVESFGRVQSITSPAVLAQIADLIGLAHPAAKLHAGTDLSKRAVREEAKERLASGERMELGVGNYHFIYLVEVRDDGLVVDDPAGADISYPPSFLHTGPPSDLSGLWSRRLADPTHQQVARRRLATNPTALAMVERIIASHQLSGVEQKNDQHQLAKLSQPVEMGEDNFYSVEDCATYQLSVRVDLAAGKK